jgi:hypothetical protein
VRVSFRGVERKCLIRNRLGFGGKNSGVIGGKRLGEDRRSTIKQGISVGQGPAKDDLNQRAEIEVFISFLGYQTELLGSALS